MKLSHRNFCTLAAIAVAAALMYAVEPSVMALTPEAVIGTALIGLQMTPAQARVIDPILSNIARGYKNAEMVADTLFPDVPVNQRGGKIIEFNREDFRLYNTARAPGTNTKRVQYGHVGKPFALSQHALEGTVPFEIMQEANQVPGVDQGRIAVMKTQNIIFLSHEKQSADKARDAANYDATNKVTLVGASQWNDPASDPSSEIEDAKEAIRARIGRYPNSVVIGAKVMAKLRQHPKLLDRIKFTGRDNVTADLLAALWELEQVRVGGAVFLDDAGALVDVWGRDVVLGFTARAGISDMGLPSYGYTYRLAAHPIVETPYQDRSAKSWVYPVTDELDPNIAGADAGFLITNAVA